MKTKIIYIFLFSFSIICADTIKDVGTEKYKLINKIKNILQSRSDSQKNILILNEEIKELGAKNETVILDALKAKTDIRRNFNHFSKDLLKYKFKHKDEKSLIRRQTFLNWNTDLLRLKNLKQDLELTQKSILKSKYEMKVAIKKNNNLLFRLKNEIEDLDVLQRFLRNKAEKVGPDSAFFVQIEKLMWPIKNAKPVGRKGFYKLKGEKVFDYNEGLIFKVQRGEKVFPISRGILEEDVYIPDLGNILVIRHTENVRSFYIGVVTLPGVLIQDALSPDKEFGLVNSPYIELKLRFDTESLDPSRWVQLRR